MVTIVVMVIPLLLMLVTELSDVTIIKIEITIFRKV